MAAKQKVIILGAGFSSLSAAAYLAQAGYEVTVLEKNETIGGRARQFKKKGFVFDMGPSFYWMPDVFDKFFQDFGKKTADYYKLVRLDPAYSIYFGWHDIFNIPGNYQKIRGAFEREEPGSGQALDRFMHQAQENYGIAMQDLVYAPGENLLEIVNLKTLRKVGSFFKTISRDISRYVSNPKLRTILEFPVLFLGAKPSNTPAFYNFMNYADFKLGTHYPMGGMYSVVEAMKQLAMDLGVTINTGEPVTSIAVEGNEIQAVQTPKSTYEVDLLVSGADYRHTESLLPKEKRQYSDAYWEGRTLAPSALLFYVGFDCRLEKVTHHTLFFDADFAIHAQAIYDTGKWPENPLFYASFPSITDKSVAPAGMETAVFLVPIAPNAEDSRELRDRYFGQLMERLGQLTGQNLWPHIKVKESYCVSDFKKDYNALGGNAYGLANTLQQTHILRPRLKSKKLNNLYFCGQLTLPGPGVPPALISGKIVSELIQKNEKNESALRYHQSRV